MKTILVNITILLFFSISIYAYDYTEAPPPLTPVYEPETPKIKFNDIYNLNSDLYQNNMEYVYFLRDFVQYQTDWNNVEDSKFYKLIVKQAIAYLESNYDAYDAAQYDSIEEMLEYYEMQSYNSEVNEKRIIEQKLLDLMISSARYKSNDVGIVPLSLKLHHSNDLASTVLEWTNRSRHAECDGVGIRYINSGGEVQKIYDYFTDNYFVSPQYDIYRVVDGVETKIVSIDQKNHYLGRGVDISININNPVPSILPALQNIIDNLEDEEDKVGSLFYIDNFSEQYLNAGSRISYKIVSTMRRVDEINKCGYKESFSSKVYIDYDADGYVDFAPRRVTWLVSVH